MDEGPSQSSTPFIADTKGAQPTPPRPWRAFRGSLTEAARQSWRDLRAVSWKRFVLLGLYIFWLSMVLGCLAALVANSVSEPDDSASQACRPDGSFPTRDGRFDWWAPSGFFQISVASGEYSFANVKIIDIAWQVVVGRGGQALLAFLSWRVFANYIATKMTEAPVTFATFWVVFLHQEATLPATYRLIREFILHRRPGSVTATIFIIITTIYILVFPTFVNSMSGYETFKKPYVEAADGNMLLLEEFDLAAYIIHDGSRINLTDEYIVPYNSIRPLASNWDSSRCDSFHSTTSSECDLLKAVSDYTREYGFYGLKDDEDTEWTEGGRKETIADPALNISGLYFKSDSDFYGYEWRDPRTEKFPFRDDKLMKFTAAGELYSLDDVITNGKCQPTEVYQWGFSFIQLFVMMVAIFIWSTGITIMWAKAHSRLPLVDEPEVPQGWHGVVELSRSIESELLTAGLDVTAVTDSKAKREMSRARRGGAVTFEGRRLSKPDYRFRTELMKWLKGAAWWLGAFAACAAVASVCVVVDPSRIAMIPFWTVAGSIAAALWLGTTMGSRLLIVLTLSLGAGVPALAAVATDRG